VSTNTNLQYLLDYFGSPGCPLTLTEFKTFWESLPEDEKGFMYHDALISKNVEPDSQGLREVENRVGFLQRINDIITTALVDQLSEKESISEISNRTSEKIMSLFD
jgi:hypothetical protein